MASKVLLAEQVLNRLVSRPDQATRTDIRDIILAVGQEVNTQIKAQHFQSDMPNGETIPNGCVMGTYENVKIEEWKTVSRALLPAMPINLPRDMGIFEISKTDNPHCVFIPALPGQLAMLDSQKLISELQQFYAYSRYGQYVEFNKNLLKDNVTTVMMRLLVMDVLALGDYDVLPIPADIESIVVEIVWRKFMGKGDNDTANDVMIQNKRP